MRGGQGRKIAQVLERTTKSKLRHSSGLGSKWKRKPDDSVWIQAFGRVSADLSRGSKSPTVPWKPWTQACGNSASLEANLRVLEFDRIPRSVAGARASCIWRRPERFGVFRPADPAPHYQFPPPQIHRNFIFGCAKMAKVPCVTTAAL